MAEASLSIAESLKTSFRLGAQEVYVTASIGISLFPRDGEDSSEVLRNAEAALQQARKQGGNNYQYYNVDMNALALNRLTLETSQRQAINNQEFITYFQTGRESCVKPRRRHRGVSTLAASSVRTSAAF